MAAGMAAVKSRIVHGSLFVDGPAGALMPELSRLMPGLAKVRTNQKVPIRSRGLERAGTERSNRS